MLLAEIRQQFAQCQSWEERYRLLIQFSRRLPKLSDDERAKLPEIHGCESRLWFAFQCSPRLVSADSDARLMQGLLFILQTALLELSAEQLADFQIATLFDELQITRSLTQTRLNGLQQIQALVQQALVQQALAD